MFKHLLVPLDGSRLAESALPAAAYLAKALEATVTLIHVIEKDPPSEVHSERHLTTPEEAQAYLSEVASQAFSPNIRVERHVHISGVSDVARSVVEHSAELAPDLVIMCTHGRSGPRDWLFGSIAQQVIALGSTPVLLVRPVDDDTPPSFTCRKLLVPLDGDVEHEQGMPAAIGLAQSLGSEMHLLMVVPTLGTLAGEDAATGKLLPGATAALLDLAELGGEEYLRHHLVRLNSAGIKTTAEVARGDPAATIVEVAHRVDADLIVLGTHGKTGTEAFWSGSVAPKISSRYHVPLLLVPLYMAGEGGSSDI